MDDGRDWQQIRHEVSNFLMRVATMVAGMCYLRQYLLNRAASDPRRNRDAVIEHYIHTLIVASDVDCISQLRMSKLSFFRLCSIIRSRGLLSDTKRMTVEEQVVMCLHTLAHNVRNRVIGVRFFRSGETVSRHFHRVLKAIGGLHGEFIKPAGLDSNGKEYFEDAVGAIDGTHVPAHVPLAKQSPYRNRKGGLSQNVLAACDFDLNFQYILAGWEGSAADARILYDALIREDHLVVPHGKYYLVDAGYANAPGFLAPYRGVRYHLNEYINSSLRPRDEKELFNYRHSSARNAIERCFGLLKGRFPILKTAPPYNLATQTNIVIVCCILHNFLRLEGDVDFEEDTPTEDPTDNTVTDECIQLTGTLASQRAREEWTKFRDTLARKLWDDYRRA